MDIVIDRRNGDIVTDRFRVGRKSTVAALRRIDEKYFKIFIENGAHRSFVVCDVQLFSCTASLIAFFREDHVHFYSLQANQTEEEWENWSEEVERKYIGEFARVMEKSGLQNPEDLPWGHVGAGTDQRSGNIDLTVAYYKARREGSLA